MAYSFYTFSLVLLVLFNGCLAQLDTQQQDVWRGLQKQQQHSLRAKTDCSIHRLTAQEPSQRFEYEAGETEYWDANNQEFQCAGVNVVRNVIQPKGLLLPHYNNAPQILYVIRGRGIQGTVFAGCAETYETKIQDESSQGDRQRLSDSHQKIREFKQGDILALPAGVTLWFYNNGDEPLQTIALLDTFNHANQLDQNFRNFFLAGNEQSGSYSRGRQQETRQRRHQQGQEQEQGNEHNIFRGFDEELLQEVFNVDRETARSLQGHEDGRGRIVRAENFQVLSPRYEDEEQQHGVRRERGQEQGGRRQREQEHGGRRERGQEHSGRREREQEHGGRSERGQEHDWPYGRRQQEHSDRREREQEHGGSSERGQEHDWPYGRRQQEHSDRREREHGEDWPYGRRQQERGGRSERQQEGYWPYGRSERGGRGRSNGLEETFCTMKLRENIEQPNRADVYNPNAGRIATVNSQTLPILNYLRLSAEKGTLYRNALVAPHWNINAHSIIYVIRGSARIQVVGDEGRPVLDEEVRQGQLVIVPQNFAVVKKAGEDGFEYIAFKTNDNAVTSPIAGRLSALRGLPVDVLANAYQISREDAQSLKYNREEATLLSPTRGSSRSRMSKAMDFAMQAIGSIM